MQEATPNSDVTLSPGRGAGTALHLVNNGVAVNERNNPHIFRNMPQVLKLPSRSAPVMAHEPTTYERMFGQGQQQQRETTSHELSRLEILTVRQLQRALQNKILQSTRPSGLHAAFHKMASGRSASGQSYVAFSDLRKAVHDFNLHAPDELARRTLLHDAVPARGLPDCC